MEFVKEVYIREANFYLYHACMAGSMMRVCVRNIGNYKCSMRYQICNIFSLCTDLLISLCTDVLITNKLAG